MCLERGSSVPQRGGDRIPPETRPWENPDALRVGELLVIEFSGRERSAAPARGADQDGRPNHPAEHRGRWKLPAKPAGDLEDAIHNLYVPNYYRYLTVIVRNEGRFFYVKGQVRNPNQYPYIKEMTVLKAIAVAGDFTDFAKKTKVLVTRADGRKVTVNCIKAMRDDRSICRSIPTIPSRCRAGTFESPDRIPVWQERPIR